MKTYFFACLILFQVANEFLNAQETIGPRCDTVEYKQIHPFINCLDPWQLVPEASDEFDGNSLDLSKWAYMPEVDANHPNGQRHSYNLGTPNDCHYQSGKPGANGDLAYYTLGNNLSVSNGTLKLFIRQEAVTGKVEDWNSPTVPYPDGFLNERPWQFTAGSIVSRQNYAEGKYEIRCKIPKINGLWPSFWLYGEHEQEIDVFEFGNSSFTEDPINASKINVVTTHRNVREPYKKSLDGHDNHCDHQLKYHSAVDLSEDFHIYSAEWNAYQITFRLDGLIIYTIRSLKNLSGQTADVCGAQQDYIWNKRMLPTPTIPMQIIVKCGVANFCSPQNPLFIGTYPATMEVDYIRVFKQVPEDIYTCTPFSSNNISINKDNYYGTDVKHIGNTITNNGSVEIHNGADVWWTAGSYLEFTNGFKVDGGAMFTAEIAMCQHNVFKTTNDEADITNTNSTTGEITQIQNADEIKMFVSPNPNHGRFDLQLKNIEGPSEIFIYSDLGQVVYQQKINGITHQIDLSSYPRGIYFVKVQNANKIYTGKVVIQ